MEEINKTNPINNKDIQSKKIIIITELELKDKTSNFMWWIVVIVDSQH